ncbi:MAG: hypothetical protein A2W23_10485 [Planctomycetes bacterium RBG_16_43_13]|nr:MAG: hypothetical protein A2W23_10485 [Planctomycetes bacterium RBG_16_43_13]
MKIFIEAFAVRHRRRDRPSGLSDGQWTNLKVCPYAGCQTAGCSKGFSDEDSEGCIRHIHPFENPDEHTVTEGVAVIVPFLAQVQLYLERKGLI